MYFCVILDEDVSPLIRAEFVAGWLGTDGLLYAGRPSFFAVAASWSRTRAIYTLSNRFPLICLCQLESSRTTRGPPTMT